MKKANISSVIIIGLMLLTTGCVSNKTCFYQIEKTDTIPLKQHLYVADTMKILIVKMSKETSPLMDNFNFKIKQGGMQTTPGIPTPTQPHSGVDIYQTATSGDIRNQEWLNDLLQSQLFKQLKEVPVGKVKLLQPSQKTISQSQLDSLLKVYDTNLVISVDSITFHIDQQHQRTGQHTEGLVPTPPGGGMTSHWIISTYTDITYRLYLTLFHVHPLQHKLTQETKILQTGIYKDTTKDTPIGITARNITKVGEDFTLLFRRNKTKR